MDENDEFDEVLVSKLESEKSEELIDESSVDESIYSIENVIPEADIDEEIICGSIEEVPPTVEIPLTKKEILSKFVDRDRSLYTHMMLLLEEIIMTRPRHIVDYFDQYSYVRRRIKLPEDDIFNVFDASTRLTSLFISILRPRSDFDNDDQLGEEDEFRSQIKIQVNLVDFVDYFEHMNVGLPKEEAFQITVSIRNLAQNPVIRKARFWGKIFGLEKSYYVAECELTYQELAQRKLRLLASFDYDKDVEGQEGGEYIEETEVLLPPTDAVPKLFQMPERPIGEDYGEGDDDWLRDSQKRKYPKLTTYKPPPLPRAHIPKAIKTKSEVPGEGANKKSYYVCNDLGDEWISLPDVTPEQIVTARQIKYFFTGYLFKTVNTYPPFPGTEKEYLRAQIARISAGTQVSPLGFFQFGGSYEGAEGGGEGIMEIVPNLDFEPIPYQDLLNTEFWVHHAHHILTLGRTTWWDPKMEQMPEEMGEEETPLKEEGEYIEPEIGPTILTPISEDMCQEELEPWTIRSTSKLIPGSGVVAVRSNLWPGAYAFAKERIFENIYIGWGYKYQSGGFTPFKQPSCQVEYELGPEIMEIDDPTPELEKEWADAHKPPQVIPLGEGGEFGEGSHIYTEPEEAEEEDD